MEERVVSRRVDKRYVPFEIICKSRQCRIHLAEDETVGVLRKKISATFQIPETRLIITGWKIPPDNDEHPLYMFIDIEWETILFVEEREWDSIPERTLTEKEKLEIGASWDFVQKVSKRFPDCKLTFHIDLLEKKIANVCLGPLAQRKVLLLYLHTEPYNFSTVFWRNAQKPEITDYLNKHFCIIAWDLEAPEYHQVLIETLDKLELNNISNHIRRGVSAAFLLVATQDRDKEVVDVLTVINNQISDDGLLQSLQIAVDCHIQQGIDTSSSKKADTISSKLIQQSFADLLGDRDYESYEFDQHEYLQKNIIFSMYGPPTDEEGYTPEIKKKTKELFQKIVDKSNEFTEYKDYVEIAFIYNCVEPLPSEKKKKKKTDPEYDPDGDTMPYPVFVLRKCRGSNDPCRIFIDHMGRVYKTWKEYLEDNKLPECVMVYPKNGRYAVDEDEEVILEKNFSPACSTAAKVLNGLDIAGAVTGLASTGVGIGASIATGTAVVASAPILAAALPVVAAGAMATAAITGLYSMGRSTHFLVERAQKEEDINLTKAEVRGAIINIVAGSFGFIGAGANLVFSNLIARGAQVGARTAATVNAINVTNLVVGGISVASSVGDVIHGYVVRDEKPSALVILQLSSNILFFGHAVYSFKSATTIIDETQARVLQDYKDSLRSNRHRKTMDRIVRETIKRSGGDNARGKAEVISTLRTISNKDEAFAALTRNLSKLSKKGIRVAAKDGRIQFNGQSIDISEFSTVTSKNLDAFISSQLGKNTATPKDVFHIKQCFMNSGIRFDEVMTIAQLMAKILYAFDQNTKEKIIQACSALLKKLGDPLIQEAKKKLPKDLNIYYALFELVMKYLSDKAADLAAQYDLWQETMLQKHFHPSFNYIDPKKAKNAIEFIKIVAHISFGLVYNTEQALKELLRYFFDWYAGICSKQEMKESTEQERYRHSRIKKFETIRTKCSICNGHYFKKL